MMLGAHLFGLPSRFGAGVCFLSVTWRGEAFQGVDVLILLAALFLPSVAPAS
jgi:hypothetical protein